jgi:AcrR family transcriptional regulator
MSPRRYDASRRREAAAVTRAQILDAARSILSSGRDLRGFSMEAIAKQAGVARMTVYYQFRSRSALLEAVADDLAERGGMQRLREAFMAPDLEQGLRKLARTFVTFWAADRVAMGRLRALGVVSPGAFGGPRGRDAWRREAIANLLGRFERSGRSAQRWTREEQIDLICALTSFETFDSLCTGDRSPDAVAELLGEAATAWLRGRAAGQLTAR